MSPVAQWLLVCCTMIVIGPVIVVVVAATRHLRSARTSGAPPRRTTIDVTPPGADVLPDFAVVDCGDQIHFVPVREGGHVVGPGSCPCRPRRTANRRRCGGRVAYLDHRSLSQRSSIRNGAAG